MHQDLIHAKTGLPLDFEWVGVLNPQFGAVRLMIASIRITERKWKPDIQHNRKTDNLYNSQTDDL